MDHFIAAIRGLCDHFLNHSGPFAMSFGDGTTDPLLAAALGSAVPLRIWEVRAVPETGREHMLAHWRHNAIDALTSRGHLLLHRSRTRGETAGVFNHLARGIAALSFTPGGVCVFGWSWCAKHHPAGLAISRFTPCSPCGYETSGRQ